MSKVGKARQVIIGNSAAGLSAIKAIRGVDSNCPITLISAERCNAYSPVSLTYYIKGRIPRESLFIVDSDFYRKNNVEKIFGIEAIAVDPLSQKVHLENGREFKYDNLLIATGASPIGLPVSVDEACNIFSLRTVEDAERILERAKKAKEVVVVGAGLIGLQVVDALFREEAKIILIECSKQVLPGSVDSGCATIIQKEIESHGVTVLLRNKVEGIRNARNKAIVISNPGGELIADMVIVAIGLKPNIRISKNSGIKMNRGILVDERMRTNIINVFAAGDVSEGRNLVTSCNEVLPNWPNACSQGRVAGLNMTGGKQRYEGLSEVVTTVFGLAVVSIGLFRASKDGAVEELCFADPEKRRYRKILLGDNRIVGAVLLERGQDAGMLKSLIRNRKDISAWKKEIAKFPLDTRKLLLSVISGQDFTFMMSNRRLTQCMDGWGRY